MRELATKVEVIWREDKRSKNITEKLKICKQEILARKNVNEMLQSDPFDRKELSLNGKISHIYGKLKPLDDVLLRKYAKAIDKDYVLVDAHLSEFVDHW